MLLREVVNDLQKPHPTRSHDGPVARVHAVRAMLGWRAPTAPGGRDPRDVERALATIPPHRGGPRAETDRLASGLPAPPKRPRGRTLLWLPLVILLVLSACESRRGIVLWHAYQGTERDALMLSAATWNAEHPDQPLELVGVPYKAFADKLTSAIPGGNGPDLFIYPQDRIGDWADAGVIEPLEFWVDDARADRFSSEAVAAMGYKGSLWGLPLAVESLVLYYRTDLVTQPPRTTNELIGLGPEMRSKDGYALAYSNRNLYGHAPWLFGYGGTVFDEHGALAIATPEAAAAMAFARELVDRHITPERTDSSMVATLFNERKAATVISGPWFVSDIAEGVPWKIATLPLVSATGKPAKPFLGTEGVLMSARAHDKAAAFAVMDALTSDAAAAHRAKLAGQVVPNIAVYSDPAIASDPILTVFRAQLEQSVPMPITPAMRLVWTPYETALGEVIAGRVDPGAQLLATEREIAAYISGVQK